MVNDFKNFMRDNTLKRLDLNSVLYEESLKLTLRLFNSSLEKGIDVSGKEFTLDELDVMNVMTNKIGKELKYLEMLREEDQE